MEIRNNFVVPLPPDEAWKVLIDIPRIVPCMPGAALTQVIDDRSFKGNVAVKLGPVALVFSGTAKFDAIDPEARSARARAQGSDTKGRGGANATVSFALSPAPEGTRVDVVTDITLHGMVAQYGRGIGMIQALATQLINEFATSLRAMLAHEKAQEQVETALGSERRPVKPISGFSLVLRTIWSAIVRLLRAKDAT